MFDSEGWSTVDTVLLMIDAAGNTLNDSFTDDP